MYRSNDTYYFNNPDNTEIRKLENLFQTAKLIIDSMSAQELPLAFRMAFRLLDRTGKIICLSSERSNMETPNDFPGFKRRHNSCIFKRRNGIQKGIMPHMDETAGMEFKFLTHSDLTNCFSPPMPPTRKMAPPASSKGTTTGGQEDQHSDISVADIAATTSILHSSDCANDPYDTGSQSSGKDNNDLTTSSSPWLPKMKETDLFQSESIEEHENPSPNKNEPSGQSASPKYPQCSSAPIRPLSACQSPPKMTPFNYISRKDRRRNLMLPNSRSQFPRMAEMEFVPKNRMLEQNPSSVCLSKNWKVAHSDRLNALIDECERIIDGRKVFKCKFCGKMYDIKSSMRYHMKIIHLQLHLRTSEMQCRICGKQFTCISAVNRHQLKCSSNSSSTYVSSHPSQASYSGIPHDGAASFLNKPPHLPQQQQQHKQSNLPVFPSHQSPAFMNLSSSPSMRWGGGIGRSSMSVNHPFSFGQPGDHYPLPQTSRNQDMDPPNIMPRVPDLISSGGRFGADQHLFSSTSPLAHSVQNLVEGVSPLSFNDVLFASFGRPAANGTSCPDGRKLNFEDQLTNYVHLNSSVAATESQGFLSLPKRMRISELLPPFSSSETGMMKLTDNLYERLTTAHTDASAIDLSRNASMTC